MDLSKIKEGMMVQASGEPVGTVDHLDGGNYIKLKRSDSPDGVHRWIPTSFVSRVDDRAVLLSCTKAEFDKKAMRTEPTDLGLDQGATKASKYA